MNVAEFIARWKDTGASERANKDSYCKELCRVLGVPEPNGKTGDPEIDSYVFEANALLLDEEGHPSVGSMDLYKRGCFVLEAKQGSDKKVHKKVGTARRATEGWNMAMAEAAGQAFGYARTLDDPPPFVIVADIGYCFDLYASFDGTAAYRPFPNAQKNRLLLKDLATYAPLLRQIWVAPYEMDPALNAERVTKAVASELAKLVLELEAAGHPREVVEKFVMRCIFTMFAEDVGLLRDDVFKKALEKQWIPEPESFKEGVEALWDAMNEGKRFFILGKLLRFNGGLFRDPVALPLDKKQLKLLHSAASHEWGEVEPAIFGTLMERVLDPQQRHNLGAHFTPTSFVRRLLVPTIEEPIRAEWDLVRVAVRQLVPAGEPAKPASVAKAREAVRAFQRRLASTTVLDPACGTGNFLYVALSLFKELESEVLATLYDLGVSQLELSEDALVMPKQFLGIETRPGSKEIAQLVLWIGYLQWHHRMYGGTKNPPEPVMRDDKNIDCRDALLGYSRRVTRKSEKKWDGQTKKKHPVTGKLVPDARFTAEQVQYDDPCVAPWPKADFVIGNPPFTGNKLMLRSLGEGYVDALRNTYYEVPRSVDYVVYWWHRAAELVRTGQVRRAGFITTNSIRQKFNRRVVEAHIGNEEHPVSLIFAVPDHPWIDERGAADVRVSMTVLERGASDGVLIDYSTGSAGTTSRGRIHADLTIGAAVVDAVALRANSDLCGQGVKVVGDGFFVDTPAFCGGAINPNTGCKIVRRFVNPRDIKFGRTGRHIIDFFGMTEKEARAAAPKAYQRAMDLVKPIRETNRRGSIRDIWWRFAWERPDLRTAMRGLQSYFVTLETAKHRFFVSVPVDALWDGSLFAIASDDAFVGGVLSSRVHVEWSLAMGGRMGVGNDPRYTSTRCFETFPFPDCSPRQKEKLRAITRQIEAHRNEVLSKHGLDLTALYNVLAKQRSNEELTNDERVVHEKGLVSILGALHDELDAATVTAYGWPANLSSAEMLSRLSTLNAERAEEERQGHVRWLRPDFQNTSAKVAPERAAAKVATAAQLLLPWPAELPSQVAAVRDIINGTTAALSAGEVARLCEGASSEAVVPALETLEALGLAASFRNGSKRWKGLAKTTGERVHRASDGGRGSSPPPAASAS